MINNTTTPNTNGINIQKRFLDLEEALPFFPGRKGKHMTLRSMRTKMSRGKVPGLKRLPTGKVIFDRDVLIGQTKVYE